MQNAAGALDARALPIAVLISGGGSTLANLIQRLSDGRLRGVRIVRVISSRNSAGGIQIARGAALPVETIRPRDFADAEQFSRALAASVGAAGARLVLMGGFLCWWRIPAALRNRVLNIHPSLLPRFGGVGMHGQHVHRAVLAAGVRETGCTVHLADDEYDHGPIVACTRVPVLPDDDVETLAARVGAAERDLYPRVLQVIADRGVEILDAVARGERPALDVFAPAT